ncbi:MULTISPECIES: Panacea domain-containing protein [unclassified Chelatococcus]|uniref:Panacea domain-containing protein n=1 Tax=unclassified Chelatococcus TaxID=2638111 RepID=UPI00035CDEF1|nr:MULTISPECIES: Panacea domain-containing protein [unclassified Chelatococcus]ALA17185.1 hypothetical protein AL346_06915 [Chelatococcus sp. CO-6]
MDFVLNKEKAVEALVYVAAKFPGVGRFHAAKILYFAERFHLRRYGRPILGDRYIAMDHGPVPSFAYDVLKGTVYPSDRKLIEGALVTKDGFHHPEYEASREPDMSLFSQSDIECLDEAIEHCAGKSFGEISDETHEHVAWAKANLNGPMSYDDMLAGVSDEILEDARVFAAYGVL